MTFCFNKLINQYLLNSVHRMKKMDENGAVPDVHMTANILIASLGLRKRWQVTLIMCRHNG